MSLKTGLCLLGLLCELTGTVSADDWNVTTQGAMFYTDDAALFSATRRLTLDGDPTQPALDNRLTGQGADGVFEPLARVSRSYQSAYGTSTLSAQGQAFLYFNETRYNQGSLLLEARQDFSPKTALLLRYFLVPNMYLGENIVRVPGMAEGEEAHHGATHPEPDEGSDLELASERLTSQLGSIRVEQAVADNLTLRLLGRFGTRRYTEKFAHRDLNLWTFGPHLEWRFAEIAKLTVGYHFERGTAEGGSSPELADDVSYNNNYASTELEIELPHDLSLISAVHFERNDWNSAIVGDERFGAFETVWQGEALLVYRATESVRLFGGVQHSSRSENVSSNSILNTNVALGVKTTF